MGGGPGSLVSAYGGIQSANAAGKAAKAAERTAAANRAMVLAEGNRQQQMALDYAKASPQELRAYEGSLASAVRQNEQDLKLMDSIDPALMEASKQVLGLVRGEQSSSGGIYETQRNSQRQALVNRLRSQFGPGAESSSLGLKALQDFDSQSAVGSVGVQQSSLSSLLGFMSNRPDMSRSSAFFNSAGANYAGVQSRLATTAMQTGSNLLGALTGSNQAVQQTAGSDFVGAQLRGQAIQQFGNQWQEGDAKIMEAGAKVAGSMMGSDRRLKKDIERLGFYAPGIPQYKFKYKDAAKYGEGIHIGVMAQDLLEIDPKHPAVTQTDDGFYMVDYDRLGKMNGG